MWCGMDNSENHVIHIYLERTFFVNKPQEAKFDKILADDGCSEDEWGKGEAKGYKQ